MTTENTSLKNTTPAGDTNTTNEMVIGKINTYQRTFLILTGSLLALLVVIAVAGTSGGQHLQSPAYEIAEGAGALVDYQVDPANLALTKDIFGLGAVSGNDEGIIHRCPGYDRGKYYCDGHCCENALCTVGCHGVGYDSSFKTCLYCQSGCDKCNNCGYSGDPCNPTGFLADRNCVCYTKHSSS